MSADHLNFILNGICVSPSTCIIIQLHGKVVTKVVNPTSTRSHCSWLSGYDCRIMPFVDVEGQECIEHVSDKEVESMENDGMEDNRGSYRASIHGFTLTTMNVLICGH